MFIQSFRLQSSRNRGGAGEGRIRGAGEEDQGRGKTEE